MVMPQVQHDQYPDLIFTRPSRNAADLLESYGGHMYAAGITLEN